MAQQQQHIDKADVHGEGLTTKTTSLDIGNSLIERGPRKRGTLAFDDAAQDPCQNHRGHCTWQRQTVI
jgi:hypothetical protein